MKKLFVIAALTITTFTATAQEGSRPIKFSIGAELALPVGNFINSGYRQFGDIYSFGIGASVQGTYAVAESLGLTLHVGYLSYSPKSLNGIKGYSLGVFPILAGIEYNFTPKVFATAQLGYSIFTGEFLSDTDARMGGFSYAPGFGFRFTEDLSALLKYQGTSATLKYDGGGKESGNIGQVGLRIAYSF